MARTFPCSFNRAITDHVLPVEMPSPPHPTHEPDIEAVCSEHACILLPGPLHHETESNNVSFWHAGIERLCS